jgi:aryl-alcohol dehydrogenase-like predicted oxidoreductase
MTSMVKTIPFGKTGVSVSEICLGAMHIGSNTPADESTRILDTYTEAGGSFIDTANIYNRDAPGCSGGDSERFIGLWMRDRHNRSELFIATKVGMHYPEQPEGLRAGQIEIECEKSLKRLGVDTIDLYYAHADDRNTPIEESLRAFDRLVSAGKVRFIGASNYLPTRLSESVWTSRTNSLAEYCCIQQRYSYIRPKPGADFGIQKATNTDLLDYCRTHSFPLIGYAPLLKGAVAGRNDKTLAGGNYDSDDGAARLKTLRCVAGDLDVSMAALALAWMMHHEAPVIPLIGASSVAQLRDNLSATEIALDAEMMARLG